MLDNMKEFVIKGSTIISYSKSKTRCFVLQGLGSNDGQFVDDISVMAKDDELVHTYDAICCKHEVKSLMW